MWSTEASAVSSAPAEVLWNLWTNVSEWPAWDPDVQWSKLNGEFREGTGGVLKPRGGPAVNFKLIEVETGRAFDDSAALPLARMVFRHRLDRTETGTRITHRVEITGPLGALFGLLIGRGIRKSLPSAVERLARLAEKEHLGAALASS